VRSFFINLWANKGAGWRVARCALLLGAGVLVYVVAFESKFIYFPAKYPEGDWETREPRAAEGVWAARVEDVWLQSADGVRIHGWHFAPVVGRGGKLEAFETDRAVLFLHGNAGNVSHRRTQMEQLTRLPARVLVIDYRGYGRSEGTPSEAGLYADATAAWDYLTRERGLRPERVVIFGESLGGAVAVDLAARVGPCALVLQSTFTSVADMAAEVMPFVPRFLIRTKMDSLSKIGRVRAPKLFVHSPADEIVPYRLGRRLFDAAPEPKQFHEIEDAPHNLTHDIGGAAYLDALRRFIDSACGERFKV
jgi:uncharacterized protein